MKTLLLIAFVLASFVSFSQDTTTYKMVHLRYLTLSALRTDVKKLFEHTKEADYDWRKMDLTGLKQHAYIKIERDTATGLPTALDIYLLTPKSFVLPPLSGSVITTRHTHYFLGHKP